MSDGSNSAREPAWDDVLAWLDTIDAITRGLGHSLNNRALALGATIDSLDGSQPPGAELTTALAHESARLTAELRHLRTLPFAFGREPLPLLLHDVLSAAVELHRAHASLGEVPVYLEGSSEAPPVLAPEPAMVHAALVTLTALKAYAEPGGVVRIGYAGTAERAEVEFTAQRDPDAPPMIAGARQLVRPTALAAALLHDARIEIEQRIGPHAATIRWSLPSLRAMRRLLRDAAQATAD